MTVSTSTWPSSSPGGIINAILRGTYVYTTYPVGTPQGITIPPNSEAQFTMIFESNPAYDASKGWPQTYPVSGGEDVALGPYLTSDPSSIFSPYTVRYAVFTCSFCVGGSWLTGPQGPIDPTYSLTAPADTWVEEVDSPSNWTLHQLNQGSTNETGQITMGYSSVVFTPSRPYLYPGLATIGVAVALSVATGLVSRRKPEASQKSPVFGKEIPSDALCRF